MFNAEKAKNVLVEWIRDWFDKNGKDCVAVVGISGGKDSSVVAALCVEALGRDRVLGVLMPNGLQNDIKDAYQICNHLDIGYTVVNIESIMNDYLGKMFDVFCDINEKQIALGRNKRVSAQTSINLPPRIRMTMLYAISQSVNGRVACTDNLSESYIGYSTRWGDNVGDFAPIADLTSEEVVAVGDALGLPYELTHKVPSDGLCGKTDEDRFGFTYEVLNRYITTGECEDEEVKKKIDAMHKKNKFKQEPIPKPTLLGDIWMDDK